jgi:hypothetical protein
MGSQSGLSDGGNIGKLDRVAEQEFLCGRKRHGSDSARELLDASSMERAEEVHLFVRVS